MYSVCTELDINPEPSATPIFRPHKIPENYFSRRATPQTGTLKR